jgi:hypothetical protein
MAMKETVGSLRADFFFAGIVAILLSLRDFGEVDKLPSGLPASWMFAIWFPLITRLALGAGFVAAGATLKSALPRGATWIKQMLLGVVVVFVIDAVAVAGVFGVELGRTPLIQSIIALLITAYLLSSVRRLATEAMAGTAPQARVVP